MKFNGSQGTDAWVSFRGSWDRSDPSGYYVALIKFANGQPVDPPDSNTSALSIFSNVDNSVCPDSCFRPTGLTFDNKGRLFMASDASGEIYVITATSTNSSTTGPAAGTSTSSGSTPSATASGSSGLTVQGWATGAIGLLCILFALL